MDALQSLLAVPSWAVNFCPVYLIAAAIVVVANFSVFLAILFLGPAFRAALSASLKMTATAILITLGLNTVVIVFMALLQFWVCKSALTSNQVKEAFAVKCKSLQDCTAVAGVPQGTACTCGERGVCGGCTFQNNMEPNLFPNNDGGIAPYSAQGLQEGFRSRESFKGAPRRPKVNLRK